MLDMTTFPGAHRQSLKCSVVGFALSLAVLTPLARCAGAAERPDTLALTSFVEGAGPPVVMLGGGTLGAAEFAPHALALAGEHRVIRLQALNVECSAAHRPLPPHYSIRIESDAMTRSLDRLGLTGPVDVVGHSFGALVALDFALQHPARVRRLVLAEPPAFWVVAPAERRADAGMRAMLALTHELGPTTEPTDSQLVRFRCALGNCETPPPPGDSARADWDARRAALRGLSAVADHADNPARLARFPRPVLIVTGSHTVPFHRRIDEILAATLPHAERLELPGVHNAVRTARDSFVVALRTFLDAGRR